jgi:selenocysteine-specific elongation factor
MIIGTAGHTDHGKTTLVRALTGVETDRLKEEKARGISIELGYAYAPLATGEVVGFIDVPGHERLVHTMVAGACGIDLALLVVAADDGLMPQTYEHLDILQLLGIERAVVALTKIDRSDGGRLRRVETDIAAALGPTPWNGAPIFRVNPVASDDPGTQLLRQYLWAAASGEAETYGAVRPGFRGPDRLFRLAVDRVFTLPGHGTIVTGTAFAGRVHVGGTLTVMPSGREVRVRSIHAQSRPAQAGCGGQRCALNLAGIERCDIARGDWLVQPGALWPSRRVDVRLRLLPQGYRGLRAWSPVHFHSAATHRVAHLVPLDAQTMPPGAEARVQLVFERAVCCAPGDRFIVRDATAARTLGGGVVLDPSAPARRRRSVERLRYLDALEQMIAGDGVTGLLDCAPWGLTMADLVRLTGAPPACIALPPGAMVIAAAGEQRFVLLQAAWDALKERALAGVRRFHAEAPEEAGLDTAHLRRIAAPNVPTALWRIVIEQLVQACTLARSGLWLHFPGHAAVLSEADRTLLERLEPLLAAGRYDPPWLRELAASLHEPEERVRAVLRTQVNRGVVYQVVHDLFYHARAIQELADLAAELTRTHGALEAAHFRDAAGIGRKRAVQILEFFDRIGYTRRVRNLHVLRDDCGWRAEELWKAHVPGGATGLQTREGAPDASW